MVEASDIVTEKMINQFIDPEEYIMVSDKCLKLKANGTADKIERIYVQTTEHIYTFKSGKRSRYYHIKDVGAIIRSSQTDTDFMLFFYNSDDLHIRSSSAKELQTMLTLRFFTFNRNYTLRIYSVTDNQLCLYHQTNNAENKMNKVYDLPDDSTRLKDEEMKGEDEYNEEMKKKREGNVDNNIFANLNEEDDDEEADTVGELPGQGEYKGKTKKIDAKDAE